MKTWLMVNIVCIFYANVLAALWCLFWHTENGTQFFNANPIGQNGGYDLSQSVFEVSKEFVNVITLL